VPLLTGPVDLDELGLSGVDVRRLGLGTDEDEVGPTS